MITILLFPFLRLPPFLYEPPYSIHSRVNGHEQCHPHELATIRILSARAADAAPSVQLCSNTRIPTIFGMAQKCWHNLSWQDSW